MELEEAGHILGDELSRLKEGEATKGGRRAGKLLVQACEQTGVALQVMADITNALTFMVPKETVNAIFCHLMGIAHNLDLFEEDLRNLAKIEAQKIVSRQDQALGL